MSDLLHPYEYRTLDDLTYEFVTAHGAKYVAYFLDMAAYSRHFSHVYTFDFDAVNEVEVPHDDRIADTICTIFGRIFTHHRNAVIIVCDSTDHREQGRNRLFQQWFLRINRSDIYKIDKQYHSEDYAIYTSLFIHAQNPDFLRIVEEFVHLTEHGFIPDDND